MYTTSKNYRNIFIAIALLLPAAQLLSAQTIAEIYSENNNSFIIKVEGLKDSDKPERILLIYDSNLIALETEAFTQSSLSFNSSPKMDFASYSMSAMSSYLQPDYEEEMLVEDWMLSSFDQVRVNGNIPVDEEEEMPMEAWMVDLNSWNDEE